MVKLLIFLLITVIDSASFKFKQKITRQTENNGTRDVKIMVLLKYLSNIWRTLEMPLIKLVFI